MLAKIIPVVIYRHLLQRKPAVLRFAQMAQHSFVVVDQILYHRVETRIVNHDKVSGGILINHADALPDLDSQCAVAEGTFELRDGFVFPTCRIPSLQIKSAGEVDDFRWLPRLVCCKAVLSIERTSATVDVYSQQAEGVFACRVRQGGSCRID